MPPHVVVYNNSVSGTYDIMQKRSVVGILRRGGVVFLFIRAPPQNHGLPPEVVYKDKQLKEEADIDGKSIGEYQKEVLCNQLRLACYSDYSQCDSRSFLGCCIHGHQSSEATNQHPYSWSEDNHAHYVTPEAVSGSSRKRPSPDTFIKPKIMAERLRLPPKNRLIPIQRRRSR